jgi:formylglycine-generating enzyme required for sulfatase activity
LILLIRTNTMRNRIAAAGICLMLTILAWTLRGQAPIKCPGPLTEKDLIQLIKGEVPEARIGQYLRECGVGFSLDAEAERRLREAGASAGILTAVRKQVPAPAAVPPPSQESADTVFWNSIRDSNDRSLFEEYMRRFPQGVFKTLAKRKLRDFRAADLRKQIGELLTARQWSKATDQIKELLSLFPDDEQAKKWQKQVDEGAAADRAAAEKADKERLARAEEDRALREALSEFAKDFVTIPAGSFTMGCSGGDGECEKDEKPPHVAQIAKPFEMQKHEVTQVLWQAVMGNNPSEFKGMQRPVENVSWDDVQEFLRKLNDRNDGYRYRLPTEAEWEYAARAGTTGKYYGDLDAIAWYDDNSGSETHPVGGKQPNGFGLFDMVGNVWEWCQDWYDDRYYGNSPPVDPTGPVEGKLRILRGGSWSSVAWNSRVSRRRCLAPVVWVSQCGFRCVREAG